MKRHRNLMPLITSTENLRRAYASTAKGKKKTQGYLEFKEYAEANILLIQEELRDNAYQIGDYRVFTIREPKPRIIHALDFKDRLVQHALMNVISPFFEAELLPYTFACRIGHGTHAGVRHVQSMLRHTKATYFLKTDFRKYFMSIVRPIVHGMIEAKIACAGTLNIIRQIIPTDGCGMPIGSLTSQLYANVYANAVDRFIHFKLKIRSWARYMDDIVILGHDKDKLLESFGRISEFSRETLKLTISKWQISPVSQGVDFLGYRIWPTHKLLRKSSVVRAKRKVKNCIEHNDRLTLDKFLASWLGHARWADTHNLIHWVENTYGYNHQFAR